jgi:hypothetical protein
MKLLVNCWPFGPTRFDIRTYDRVAPSHCALSLASLGVSSNPQERPTGLCWIVDRDFEEPMVAILIAATTREIYHSQQNNDASCGPSIQSQGKRNSMIQSRS